MSCQQPATGSRIPEGNSLIGYRKFSKSLLKQHSLSQARQRTSGRHIFAYRNDPRHWTEVGWFGANGRFVGWV